MPVKLKYGNHTRAPPLRVAGLLPLPPIPHHASSGFLGVSGYLLAAVFGFYYHYLVKVVDDRLQLRPQSSPASH